MKSLKYRQNFFGNCHCTFNVIVALFLRETYTLYGSSKFAYFWTIFRDVFAVGGIILIRLLLGIRFEKGMHIVFFVLCGFLVYHIITDTITKCMTAIQGNSSILSFPHVIPLDIMISRTLLVFLTNIQAALVVVFLAFTYGIKVNISNYLLFIYCISTSVVFGFSVGVFLSSISVFYPVIEKIWPMVRRLLFWCSGVFYTVERFPPSYAKPMHHNPILQLIEGLRKSVSHGIELSPTLNFYYINVLILFFLTLGLLFQTLSRQRLNS